MILRRTTTATNTDPYADTDTYPDANTTTASTGIKRAVQGDAMERGLRSRHGQHRRLEPASELDGKHAGGPDLAERGAT